MSRTSTTWETGSTWRTRKTKVIRVPEAIADQIMAYARELDSGNAVLHGNEQDCVLRAIAAYINYKATKYHPNQHSRVMDITTRPWDEMRRFRAIVEGNPHLLGLNSNQI